MKPLKTAILGVILLPLFLFASIGKITVAVGDVSIIRASKTIKALSGSPLEEKDQVLTKSGSAQLLFSDGTSISVGSKTTFNINEFLYEEGNAQKSNAKFAVSEGAFKAITGKIGKLNPDKFKLDTKTATIGIRGTRFLGIVPADPKQPETVACTKGRIFLVLKPIQIAPIAPIGVAPAPGAKPTPGTPAPTPEGQPAPAPGQPTPGAQPTPGVPTPAPQIVEVSAGQITTISVGKIEAPKAYSPTEINKLEKATSTTENNQQSSSGTSSPASSTASNNNNNNGGGGNTPTNTPTTTTDNTPPTQPTAPKVDTGSIANTVNNVQNTVNNVNNMLTDEAQQQLLLDQQKAQQILQEIADKYSSCPSGTSGVFPNCVPIDGGGSPYTPYVDTSIFNLYPVNIISGYTPNFNVDFTTAYPYAPTAVTSSPQTNVVRFFAMSGSDSAYSYNPFKQDSQVYVNTANGNILHMSVEQSYWSSYPNIDSSLAIGKMAANGSFTVSDRSSWYSNGQIASEATVGNGLMYSNGNTFGLVMTANVGYSTVASNAGDYSFTLNDASSHFSTGDQLRIGSDIYTVASVSGNVITLTTPLLSSAYAQDVYVYNKVGGIKDSGYTIPNEAPLSASGTMPVLSNTILGSAGPITYNVTSSLTQGTVAIVQISDGSSVNFSVPVTVGASGAISFTTANVPVGTYTAVVSPYADYTSSTYNAKGTWTALKIPSAGIGNTASVSSPLFYNDPYYSNHSGNDFQATIDKTTGNITLVASDANSHLSINQNLTNSANASAYISEDVWGAMPTSSGTFDGYAMYNTRFMALPDKIDSNGFLSYSDDYSSWGYWQADYNTTATTSMSAVGWWVAGAATPTGVIDALISANTTYTYNGHVMGAAIYDGNNLEMIKMNAVNKAQISIAFGAANPISGSIQFQTGANNTALKSWSTTFSGTGTAAGVSTNFYPSGNYATNAAFGYNGVGTGSGNGSAVTATMLHGQYYGPAANSVGGVFEITAGAHQAQGVFKAVR